MIDRNKLSREFVKVAQDYYPKTAQLLSHCYVKVLECHIERLGKHFYYIGIYYPGILNSQIQEARDVFKEIAENMGFVESVCINATRLIHDPMSKIKKENPKLWLELYWVAVHKKQLA
ncbi:MAG: hypothetical protein AB4290_14720 [Spirulina sp.]